MTVPARAAGDRFLPRRQTALVIPHCTASGGEANTVTACARPALYPFAIHHLHCFVPNPCARGYSDHPTVLAAEPRSPLTLTVVSLACVTETREQVAHFQRAPSFQPVSLNSGWLDRQMDGRMDGWRRLLPPRMSLSETLVTEFFQSSCKTPIPHSLWTGRWEGKVCTQLRGRERKAPVPSPPPASTPKWCLTKTMRVTWLPTR